MFIAYFSLLRDHAHALDSKNDKTEGEVTALKHLNFFIRFIEDEYRQELAEINSYLKHGEITFDLLWVILLHRAPLLTDCLTTGQPRLVWLKEASRHCSGGRTGYFFSVEGIDSNPRRSAATSWQVENKYGYADVPMRPIWEFTGAMKISDLSAYPVQYHPDLNSISLHLYQRGLNWDTLQGMHHMHYTGTAFCGRNDDLGTKLYVRLFL